MTRKTNFLARAAAVLLLAVLCSVGTWAQSEVIAVGHGTTASSYLPSYPNNMYSMSQQIYTKDEIGKKGKITSIAFYNYDTGSARTYDIYLSHTSKTEFDSRTDWVKVAATDKVFGGTVTLSQGKWTVIDFDEPFEYDGTRNLLLTVDDNTGKDTGFNYSVGTYDGSGNQALYYYKMFGTPVNMDPTQSNTEEGSIYHRKNNIRLCFETYPKPYRLEAVEIGDTSALIQCSLRGDATAWNLRYRKAAAEGEQELRWTTPDSLITRSYTIEGLVPATKYEAQVRAIFAEDHLSDWTDTLVFTTNCCPVEQQAELIYALRSNYSSWFGFAVQIVDVTDEEKPVEVAYLHAPSYELYGGTITLCCGHKYKVNWIHDADHANVSNAFSFALYFEPGDLVFSMARGEAPEETAELTTFVMDCTPYCTPKPKDVSVTNTTFNSATLSFISDTKGGEVVYSTEADFDPNTATPASVEFTPISIDPDSWVANPANSSLTLAGLEPLTEYYVSVRSVCIDELTGEPNGISRWSDPVKVTTGSLYDAPSQVKAEPINSRTERLSWQARGSEKAFNLYYRQQAVGNPVDMSAIQTFGGGKGTGFENGNWGPGIWNSYGDRPFSNTLFVADVPAGSSFSFKAGNGKTGAGQTRFLYGMVKQEAGKTAKQTMEKFDKECLNDADRAAILKALNEKRDELLVQLADLEIKRETGQISDEEYKQQKEEIESKTDAYKLEIESLESMPTDAMKLERMKELEQKIKDFPAALADLELKYNNDQITKEERDAQKAALEAAHALALSDLEKLRAQTSSAENPNKDGFSITNDGQSPAQARGRKVASVTENYVFFIRHNDPNGVLLVKDLTITPPEQVGEWTVIKNIGKTEYTLAGLEPGTTYEVMVEPVYEEGITGSQSPITVFTTLGTETEPVPADFSVAKDKKVNFAHGNLRCEGDRYEAQWSMAKQQYEVLGQDNIEVRGTRSYPAWLVDLFCWSTTKNYYGIDNFYYYDEEEAQPYFQADFADWGENPTLIRDLGTGWQTLNKEEWNYLLNERENAAQLRSFATVAGVKGLVILPDAWTAPTGLMLTEEMTAEQWAAIEQTGVVFLPAAGQLTTTYVDYNSTTTVTEAGTYWTGTPSGDKSDMKAFVLSFTDTAVTLDADLVRRVATAVRLVKDTRVTSGIKEVPNANRQPAGNNWYDLYGRRLTGKPAQRGLYILNGKKVIVR